jgi:hypothetical protein
MIRYALRCDRRHDFESWFANSAAYDKQAARELIACPICGSTKVDKAIMAPALARTDKPIDVPPAAVAPPSPEPAAPVETGTETRTETKTPVAMISPQERELRAKLRELREQLTRNSENVGRKFPEQARKMHYGEIEHRSIYGEASSEEAKELHEEGIEFHPLPVLPDEHN